MKTRMQPIGNAWAKLPRLVRDLARELGKKIDLRMIGAETELDRQVLEMIKDPLTHMVRNLRRSRHRDAGRARARPASRRPARSRSTPTMRAATSSSRSATTAAALDDRRASGRRRSPTARDRGRARGDDRQQIQQFIFRPGFSTAEAVTNVSGRGVGMDVVRTNIEKIGGTVELRSRCGQRHELRHQDPADAGDRLGPDRRMPRRSLRHSADQCRRAGPRRRRTASTASSA